MATVIWTGFNEIAGGGMFAWLRDVRHVEGWVDFPLVVAMGW
jgi:hypothetical protein